MKKILLALFCAAMMFFPTTVSRGELLTLNQIGEASCRVHVSGAYGSGTAVHDDGQFIYVLTNNHVVGRSQTAACEFFRFGRKTGNISGPVIWRTLNEGTPTDFAIIKLNKSDFGQYPPRIIPLAPENHSVKENDYIASAGCPEARWLQLWEGYVAGMDGNKVLFTPPPLGGQSGSGVHTIINGHTYMAAVLTWRIGRGQGETGAHGGAIPISIFHKAIRGQTSNYKVPTSWEKISINDKYALGEDGKYYKQRDDGSVVLPAGTKPGLKILRWNIPADQIGWERPPGGGLLPNGPRNDGPQSPESPSPNNPFGTLPPNFGLPNDGPQQPKPTPPQTPTDPCEEYKLKIVELENQLKALEQLHENTLKDKTALEEKVKEFEGEIEGLKKQLADLLKDGDTKISQINGLNAQIAEKTKILENIEKEAKSKDTQLIQIITEKTQLQNQLNHSTEQLKDSVATESSLKWQRNIFGGVGLTGVGGFLVYLIYVLFIRKKVDNFATGAVDRIGDIDISRIINNKIDQLQSKLIGKKHLNDVVDKLQSYVDQKVGDKDDEHMEQLEELLNGFKNDILTNVDNKLKPFKKRRRVTPTSEPEKKKTPVVHQEININNIQDRENDCGDCRDYKDIYSFPVSDGVTQLFKLKERDGESVEKWACFAVLYREAIQMLRLGQLKISVVGNESAVQGQKVAADKIDAYVKKRFFSSITIEKVEANKLVHEALFGFLYKEAVAKLRLGGFNVLGHEELAEAIENWVYDEFLKRMGIDL